MTPPFQHADWHYVYVPGSIKTGGVYVGCTGNLDRRISEHTRGEVFTTKKILPVELVYFEAYRSKQYAEQREKSLKHHGNGLAKIKARIGRAG